eukprot:scaffold4.g4942.t1
MLGVPALLAAAGASRISFVGGEPLLHPLIHRLIAAAKAAGLSTSMVTNGSLLDAAGLLRLAGTLDWLAFSVDASTDRLHAALGRGGRADLRAGRSAHLAHVRGLWGMARELGYRLKLNTVVTRATLEDDMAPLVLDLRPERWKVFQVLPIEGQNDARVDELLISGAEFERWVARHGAALAAAAAASGTPPIPLVAERNEAMRGSYAMLDAPAGQFFSNATGTHVYGPPIFQADAGAAGAVLAAWAGVQSSFDAGKYLQRGGLYDWGHGANAHAAQLERWLGGVQRSAGQRAEG